MKKLLGILMLLILIPGVLGLTLVDENPGDSTTITDTSSSTPFNITTAETLSSGFVYIDSVGYGMSCAGTICNLDKDLSAKLELDTVQYYFQISDGGPLETFPAAGYYEATVDRDPAQVQNLVVSSASETALDLNWDANTEGDIDYYNVYENSTGTFIVIDTTTDNNYTDSGLTTGVEYFYQVSAVDTQTNEGLVSAIDSGIPQDTTPPADPTIDPVSGSVVTTTPTITITYAEEVYDARIYAGTTEFAALGDDTSAPYEYTWNPTLLDNALYIFNITAEDSYGNRGSYMYTLSTTSGTVDIIIGDEPPLYINIVEDYPAAYDPIYTTQLDIDWTDDVAIDTVTINFDEVDYVYGIDPEVTVVGDTYTASFLGLDAGIHNYSWTASDTKGQENMTTEQIFTINKADPGIAIIFDPVSPVSEYTETNATCSALSAAELYRNEVLLTGLEDIATLDAGTHEYNCTVAGDTNYNAAFLESSMTVQDNGPEALFDVGNHPRSSSPPGQYTVLNYTIEMPIGDGAKARMDDLIDGIETILINEESEPVLLCEENYNGDYTMDPTTYLADADYYLVDNTYNGADDPVYCTSKRTSDEIGLYNFILMIPIPSDTIAGSYSGNIYFEPWQS